jgi:glycosyltransferase 2 family protein
MDTAGGTATATATATETEVERSPADILRLAVAVVSVLVLLLLEWLVGDTLVGFGADLLRGADAVPQWVADVVVIGTRLLGLVVLGGGLVWMVARGRWRMLLTTVAAGVAAPVLFGVLDAIVEPRTRPELLDVATELGPITTRGFASTAGVAAVAAMLTAAAPWVARRWRRAGWVLIVGLVLTTFLHAPVSFDPVLAWAVGWLTGAAALVVAKTPSRRPTKQAVIDGLAAAGLPLRQLDKAGVDARGSTPYFGVATDGSKLFVKALGADERSADLLFRTYRALVPHDFGDSKPFGTLQRAIEHEAFVALDARSIGVRTPALRAVAAAEPNGYVLAYEAIDGKSLDRLDPADVSDEVLGAVWDLVGQLRRHGIAHRDLRLANVFLADDGEVWLIDFGFSEVAASELLLATDVAELAASSSLYVGAERAVAQAKRHVDPATLERAADRLRPWALSGATRTALKERAGLLDEVRRALAPPAR